MRTVDITLKFEDAESLLFLLQGSKISDSATSNLARQVETAIREASEPEHEPEPRFVGEHGEYNPNTLGKPSDG